MKTNMMELSKFIKWSVCGDGFVGYATHNKDAHYAIQRAPKHKDYIDYITNKLSTLPDCKINIKQYTRKDNNKEVIQLTTSSHPLFTRVRERQYIQNHRVIEPHMLTLIDWECLANLYFDDGSLCYNSKGTPIVRISTCAYSYPEQEALRRLFIDRFNLCFNINKASKGLYQLSLRVKDQDNFFAGLQPYKLSSYNYKFPEFL